MLWAVAENIVCRQDEIFPRIISIRHTREKTTEWSMNNLVSCFQKHRQCLNRTTMVENSSAIPDEPDWLSGDLTPLFFPSCPKVNTIKLHLRSILCCHYTQCVNHSVLVPGCSAACTPVTINKVFQIYASLPFKLGMCCHLIVSSVPWFHALTFVALLLAGAVSCNN